MGSIAAHQKLKGSNEMIVAESLMNANTYSAADPSECMLRSRVGVHEMLNEVRNNLEKFSKCRESTTLTSIRGDWGGVERNTHHICRTGEARTLDRMAATQFYGM